MEEKLSFRPEVDEVEEIAPASISTRILEQLHKDATTGRHPLWLRDALGILIDDSTFRRLVLDPSADSTSKRNIRTDTAADLSKIVDDLEQWKVVRHFDSSRLKVMALNALFLVRKSNGLFRVVVDCRPFNARCRTPPPVNLIAMEEWLIKLYLLKKGRRLYFCCADYKSYFYQIAITWWLSAYFVASCNGKLMALIVLAMGFSWAPFLALSVAWAIVACSSRRLQFPRLVRCRSSQIP